jgi:hypothetical protein
MTPLSYIPETAQAVSGPGAQRHGHARYAGPHRHAEP